MEQTSPTDDRKRPCVLKPGAARAEITICGLDFEGSLRELSVSHFGAFIRPGSAGGVAAAGDLLGIFSPGRDLTAKIEFRGRLLTPFHARVRTADASWIRDYKLLIVADLLGVSKEDEGVIAGLIAKERARAQETMFLPHRPASRSALRPAARPADEAKTPVRPQAVKPCSPPPPLTGGEAVQVTFPARRVHSAIFRSLCEGLAQQAGFGPRDVFLIKLAADEVFTNAVIHGSERYGVSRIQGDIVLDNDGITVLVRDEGGIPFNYHRCQAGQGKGAGGSVRSGLDIIDQVMDSWAVRTEQGRFTEVIFRKKRVPRG